MSKFITITFIILYLLLAFGTWSYVHASDYTDEQIVDAIYHAEGGTKAKKPFGILSVPCYGYEDCRKVCLNTVKNNRKRYADYGYKTHPDYLSFLASWYCLVGVDNDNGTNKFWLKNMEVILERNKK